MDQITKTTNRFFVVINSVDIDKYRSSNAPVIKAHRKKKKKKERKKERGCSRAGIPGCLRKDEKWRIVGSSGYSK
jgi:hypothetical protein